MSLPETFRVEIHEPGRNGPPLGVVRIVESERLPPMPGEAPQYRDTGQVHDLSCAEVPKLIDQLLARGAYEHARNLANAWFVALAHSYGQSHVALGPVASKYQ